MTVRKYGEGPCEYVVVHGGPGAQKVFPDCIFEMAQVRRPIRQTGHVLTVIAQMEKWPARDIKRFLLE